MVANRPLPEIKCVLFDLDGTLIDTVDLIYRSFDHAVKKVLGKTLSRKELLKNIGRPLAVQMRAFSPTQADLLMNAYNEHNLVNHDQNISKYPETTETLSWLVKEKAMKIGVVTSKKRDLSLRGLRIVNLYDLFDVIVAMEDTENHKPDPEPVTTAINLLHCSASETLFIGDSPFDIDAGRAAGVFTGAALWGPFSQEQLRDHEPDLELSNIKDLKLFV